MLSLNVLISPWKQFLMKCLILGRRLNRCQKVGNSRHKSCLTENVTAGNWIHFETTKNSCYIMNQNESAGHDFMTFSWFQINWWMSLLSILLNVRICLCQVFEKNLYNISLIILWIKSYFINTWILLRIRCCPLNGFWI